MSMTDHPNRIQEALRRMQEAHVEIAVCIYELRALAVEELSGCDPRRGHPGASNMLCRRGPRRGTARMFDNSSPSTRSYDETVAPSSPRMIRLAFRMVSLR